MGASLVGLGTVYEKIGGDDLGILDLYKYRHESNEGVV